MEKRNNLKYLSYFLVACLTAMLCTNGTAQKIGKKVYTEDLDSNWSKLAFVHSLSPDGNWAVIGENWENSDTSLSLVHTEKKTLLPIPTSENIQFSTDNNWLGLISTQSELELINLHSLDRTVYQNVSSFEFSADGSHIAYVQTRQDETKSVNITRLRDKKVTELNFAINYKWNPTKNLLIIYRNENNDRTVSLYDVSTHSETTICENTDEDYSNFIWTDSGNACIFYGSKGEEGQIYHYNTNGVKKLLSGSVVEQQFKHTVLSNKAFFLSADGSRVFFYRKVQGLEYEKDNDMEVWDTGEPWIYPAMKNYRERELQYRLTLWEPESDRLMEITDEQTPSVQFKPDHAYALVYDKLIYEPQYKQYPDVDLYLKDFHTGKKELIVKKQFTSYGFISLSPEGRYVAYFKDKNWWIYDSRTKKTINLTKSMDALFESISDRPTKEPYEFSCWTKDEKYIILHDQYDIWLMKPDGSYKKRVTNGKENKIRYRVTHDIHSYKPCTVNATINNMDIEVDLGEGQVVEMQGDDFSSGLALWKNQSVKTIIYESKKLENAIVSKDNTKIVFRKLWFNQPIGIYAVNQVGKSNLLFQSNKELMDYDLGTQEWISFQTEDGQTSKGILIYPSQFDPSKKYPMITWIYERNTREASDFSPPSYFNQEGFNLLKYVTNGYFVFLPDIKYRLQHPVESALISVEAGVNKALENKAIDKERLGLVGHSFGGYETAYIMTRSDLFATGVAGAPITDLPTYYHEIWWNGRNTEHMWRVENQQMRMGDSFYALKEQYYNNSPLYFIEELDKPLLLWAGKNDYNINWQQSVFMFMAMKRLNKAGKLLLFNNEPHSILSTNNKEKLSREMFQWFDTYLKY